MRHLESLHVTAHGRLKAASHLQRLRASDRFLAAMVCRGLLNTLASRVCWRPSGIRQRDSIARSARTAIRPRYAGLTNTSPRDGIVHLLPALGVVSAAESNSCGPDVETSPLTLASQVDINCGVLSTSFQRSHQVLRPSSALPLRWRLCGRLMECCLLGASWQPTCRRGSSRSAMLAASHTALFQGLLQDQQLPWYSRGQRALCTSQKCPAPPPMDITCIVSAPVIRMEMLFDSSNAYECPVAAVADPHWRSTAVFKSDSRCSLRYCRKRLLISSSSARHEQPARRLGQPARRTEAAAGGCDRADASP